MLHQRALRASKALQAVEVLTRDQLKSKANALFHSLWSKIPEEVCSAGVQVRLQQVKVKASPMADLQ